MMQVGIRLHDVKPGTLEERAAEAHRQGFKCVHLALSKTVTEYSVEDSALTPGYASYLKKVFAANELDVAVLGCYLNLAHPDPDQLKKIQNRYFAHIRFASQLGCGVVGTETGAPNAKYLYEEACHSEEALDTFIRNVKPVVACAEKFGVIFAIEPVWCHIVNTSQRALRVLQEVNSPNLQIILDPVNLLSPERHEQYDEIWKEAIEILGEHVAVLHMKDYKYQDGQVVSIACGTGVMDYTRIAEFARTQKPYIHATLEDSKPENAEKARIFVEGL